MADLSMAMISTRNPSPLPKDLERYIDEPYGGLFGNSTICKLVEEIVADPHAEYRQQDLEELIDGSQRSVARALKVLLALGLLIRDKGDSQHPLYRVNLNSRKLLALTFLAYAVVDDRDGTNCMDLAIRDYNTTVIEAQESIASEVSAGQAEGETS